MTKPFISKLKKYMGYDIRKKSYNHFFLWNIIQIMSTLVCVIIIFYAIFIFASYALEGVVWKGMLLATILLGLECTLEANSVICQKKYIEQLNHCSNKQEE